MSRYFFGLLAGIVIGYCINDTLWTRKYQQLSDKCETVVQQQKLLIKEVEHFK